MGWMYPAAANHSNNLVLLSANTVKLLEGFFSDLGRRGIIPALLRGRDLLITAGIWSWSLGSGMGICLVVWHWGSIIRMGVLICWGCI